MLYVNPVDASPLQRAELAVHSGQRTGAVLQEFERLSRGFNKPKP